MQEQHDVADDFLLGPSGDDPLRTLRADTGDLAQASWLLLDDLEHGFTKSADELFRIDGPDTADHAGAQIFFDALDRRRRRGFEERGSELDAVRAVVDPAPARLNELAGRNQRGVSDDRDEIALTSSLDAEHAEASLGVMEGDAVDQTGQNFRRARRNRGRHPTMIEIKLQNRYRDLRKRY